MKNKRLLLSLLGTPGTLLLLLTALLCTACSQAFTVLEAPPPELVTDAAVPETEDHLLLALEAPLADGRILTLEAIGKVLDEYSCGVREVHVYDGDTLLQTISVREIIESELGRGRNEHFYDYTNCCSPEESMKVLDLNFDGDTDFGLFGWSPNNTIPYYYWQWDGERYQFTCILQGVEVHPESMEISSEYKVHLDGVQSQRDYYQPDGNGELQLVRQERECFDFPNLDSNRGCALETWIPPKDVVIRPQCVEQNRDKLVLIRREMPVYEVHSDNTVSYFTEIWELKDDHLQMTRRDAYIYSGT